MDKLVVATPSGSYPIYFGIDVWKQIEEFATGYSQVLVVSDANAAALYGERLPFPLQTIEPGEEQKNLTTIGEIIDEWTERALDRASVVIALGGGVIGDLVGFAASIYRRGIAYLQVPTTLLAQVDSAVGGKTGVNSSYGKNLIGSFFQPQGVFIDPNVLKTLPAREITGGLGEVLKYGIIADQNLFEGVSENLAAFYNPRPETLSPIIKRCLTIKAEIVEEDEREGGRRKILNHGHTFGHAIEQATGFGRYKHGEAVLLGMVLEARLANLLGMLPSSELEKIETALCRVQLDYNFANLPQKEVLAALRQDKKNRQGKISFILPRKIGEVEEVLLSPSEVTNYWEEVVL